VGTIHQLVAAHGRDEARKLVEPAERRLVDIAADVLAQESASMGFTYSGFCQTALPHKRLPDDREWTRTSGRLTLMIEPGKLLDGASRSVLYGVPYGSRARLILLYLQTEAIKTNSEEVELGSSMRVWLRRMGISPGGKSYREVREQANRLSACRLTFSWPHGEGRGFTRNSIVEGGISLRDHSLDDAQGSLFIEKVRLSDTFFRALKAHPVPIWEPAIKLLSNLSMALDIYVWLAYRLHSLDKPTPITWLALHNQFGAGFKSTKHFKPRFVDNLKTALAVYEEARLEATELGLTLYPSRPPIPEKAMIGV
jgi:Plasmid encoded RepA protein